MPDVPQPPDINLVTRQDLNQLERRVTEAMRDMQSEILRGLERFTELDTLEK